MNDEEKDLAYEIAKNVAKDFPNCSKEWCIQYSIYRFLEEISKNTEVCEK